jgi:hypothetical protein
MALNRQHNVLGKCHFLCNDFECFYSPKDSHSIAMNIPFASNYMSFDRDLRIAHEKNPQARTRPWQKIDLLHKWELSQKGYQSSYHLIPRFESINSSQLKNLGCSTSHQNSNNRTPQRQSQQYNCCDHSPTRQDLQRLLCIRIERRVELVFSFWRNGKMTTRALSLVDTNAKSVGRHYYEYLYCSNVKRVPAKIFCGRKITISIFGAKPLS